MEEVLIRLINIIDELHDELNEARETAEMWREEAVKKDDHNRYLAEIKDLNERCEEYAEEIEKRDNEISELYAKLQGAQNEDEK